MEHTIPIENWHLALANTVKIASSGDTITVDTQAKVEMGKIAAGRLCPGKQINWRVGDE